ncbi:MAG: biotin--[acetyl-CoA-carboxylase] ligase [Dehalococcoidales bacterium]|jgi:BirA family biotin operon repressor/biotin-[acetyl-CoA-carboxylase] ligase|nr:biotin--[acetyl-CoA-carboxylase] ligase [Dehalococcoidales bacterium]MDP6577451.1 biotin--[acetyl-CoA-carboxylase] ligase [Dehalococcoidales bacterium]
MIKDSLSPAAITANLETRFIGQKIIYYPRLTSTMDVARRVARQGAVEGTVVVADEQTVGKGRVKRVWLSPRGSIALSLILHPDTSCLSDLIVLSSLAVARSLKTVTGLEAQIKWPNDILVRGRKVCGILVENDWREKRVAYTIIGIGINVNFRLADFSGILPEATSLVDEIGKEVSRLDLVRALFTEMERLYLALPGGDSIYREWRTRLVTLGRKVRVESGQTILEGIAESVARDGSLLLRHPDGSSTRIVTGDVHLRNDE